MVKFYLAPEVPDQDKDDSGDLLFGIQNAPTYKPLFGYIDNTNNSAIVSFTAVKYTSKKVEISRTTLSTALIIVDSANSIYKIDVSALYAELLDQCIYQFEVQNTPELYVSEYFLVQEENIIITADSTLITADNDTIYVNDSNLTI